MEDKDFYIKPPAWMIYLVSFLFLVFAYLYAYESNKEMDRNGVYVLGKVTKPGRLSVDFEFVYQGRLYQANNRKVKRNQYLGEILFVKVLPYNTNVARLIFDNQVPKCIDEAPYNGWKEIPKDTCSN